MFNLQGKVAVITGGCGVLGTSMAQCLATRGVKVAILDLNETLGAQRVDELVSLGTEAAYYKVNVLEKPTIEAARDAILEKWGHIDILINAAGGNMAGATIAPDKTIFDLDIEAFRKVFELNLTGTVLTSMVIAEAMVKNGNKGSIINISSMSAQSIITRVVGYSAAKAGIDNFTKWMSVELAKKFGEGIRMNAIAPGFFLTEQNRTLLTNPDGTPTDRTKDIIRETPFGRLGEPEELNGAIVFLASDASKFVTGTILPIDGGFSIFSGV